MKVGFVGSGNMAAAMARGWAAGEGPESMLFTDAGSGKAVALAAEVGGEVASDNRALAAASDLVVLAMKPARLDEVAAQMESSAPAVLSLLGATSLDRLQDAFPGVPIGRAMPNLAVEVRRGVVCYAAAGMSTELLGSVADLLGELGQAVEVDDSSMDAATAIMGCSPAYVAVAAEALTEAGVEEGIEPDLARRLVHETVAGTGELLLHRDAAEVRAAVASPGGSTEAGLSALDRAGFRPALRDAVRASLERMRA